MLKLDFNPSQTSKEKLFIGGVSVYLYNARNLASHIALIEGDVDHDLDVNVLYLIHQRGGDYTYMEAIAQRVIEQVENKLDAPTIAVTFDIRNHGQRLVDELKNHSWRSGNDTHALDMISCIRGTELDLKLVMEYLPGYLDLEGKLHEDLKDADVKIRYRNILSGYSMGAHTVIRFTAHYPNLVSIVNPNIGCSDLTSLLVNRLRNTRDFDKRWFYKTYEELGLSEIEQGQYPEALHKVISEEDTRIFEDFPFNEVAMFATYYSDDPLVPSHISKLWTDIYMNTNSESEVFYEEGRVHDITAEMIDRFASWLTSQLSSIA